MNFADARLLTIYGTWVKVQVEFYDFIMKAALDKLHPSLTDIEEFHHGNNDGYDALISRCFDLFETPELAWNLFLVNQGVK